MFTNFDRFGKNDQNAKIMLSALIFHFNPSVSMY